MPNVKWTAYANVVLLVCLYIMLAIELRRSHYKVRINTMYAVAWFTCALEKLIKCFV